MIPELIWIYLLIVGIVGFLSSVILLRGRKERKALGEKVEELLKKIE